MIVATAGHVDHGKTTLVRALTGVDTDRLPEEKLRGISIDLGFAYADLGVPADVGAGADDATTAEPIAFVDVPGHERLVRNMLAGVAAIDVALLVVAADDGVMPQTREHLAILQLLGLPQLVVALSKADRVAPQRLAEVRAAMLALLADGPFAQAPVFALAAPTGQGVAALQQHLAGLARGLARRPAGGHFRLAIDRSFLLAGAGRIVTGTVLSGEVRLGDAVMLSPQGRLLRVRGLHAQNRPAQAASAGQRCAVNLAGQDLKRAEPQRGDWLLAAEAHAPSDRWDLQLQVLASAAGPLTQRATLQLHIGAAAVNARLVALGEANLAPGSTGLAQALLDRPLCAAWGDRLILRDAAANRTLAGGWVIDPAGPARGRNRPERLLQLAALAQPDPAAALAGLLANAADGVDLHRFHRARNQRVDEAARLQSALPLQIVASPDGPLGLSPAAWQGWRQRVLAALDAWHAQQPDSLGPDDARLRQLLGLATGNYRARAVLRASLAALVQQGLLVRDGLAHRRAGHQPRLAEADQAWLARLHGLLPVADLRPPIVGDLATQLGLPLAALRELLARLAHHGALVRVAANRYYRPETVQLLAAHALALAAGHAEGRFDAAGYRDRTGIGRNLTVQVLEFLDAAGISRFDGVWHRPVEG